jgi:hypothetical protein
LREARGPAVFVVFLGEKALDFNQLGNEKYPVEFKDDNGRVVVDFSFW